MISSAENQVDTEIQQKEIINRNFEISEDKNKIIVDVDKSESGTIYLVFIVFFSLDTLDLLVAIQIGLIVLGFISLIFDIIIIIFLYIGYSSYKNLKIQWVFSKSKKKVDIIRKSSRIHEKDSLSFGKIEALTISENLYLDNRFIVSCITSSHKRQKMCYGEENDCYSLAKQLSDALNKPIVERNFFGISLIISSSILVLSIILMGLIFLVLSVPLTFEYVFFILLKTTLLMSLLRLIYLLKEHIQEENHYFEMLNQLSKEK
ncbi:MAG: membrane protein of unknown function [Promethearchaeota archaeon]|nr:MAG: membrane protein of unknown function [Candidatus Lokiarchaeota archaeon]